MDDTPTQLESRARDVLTKMLDALDNDERIAASSPVELLNCIMKILRIVKEHKTPLGDMVRDRINGVADLLEIKNPDTDTD